MKTPLLICTTVLFAFPLNAAVLTGDTIGTSEAEIRDALVNSGYVVESIEFDGNEIVIETRLDGIPFEIELSATTGAVIEIETEDDEEVN